jgi:hypothetical protein
MKTAFLIYRPVLDYEESETPYLICISRERAEEVRKEILDHAQELITLMPPGSTDDEYEAERDGLKFFSDSQARDAYDCETCDKRRNILKEAKWPYGIDLGYDMDVYSSVVELETGCIEIRELPLA